MVELYVEDWDQFLREASAKTDLLGKKYPDISSETIVEMEASDPAKGKSLEWMVRQLNSKIIRWPEDRERLQKALESFWQIKKSPRTLAQYSANPDLSTYTMQTLEDLDDKVRGVVERPEALTEIPDETEKIYDDGEYSIIKAKSIKAACDLAKGTKWCTADPGKAEDYMFMQGLFIWFKNGKKFAQSSGKTFMDLRDNPLKVDAKMGRLYWKLFKELPEGLAERIPELEPGILQKKAEAIPYARDVIGGRWSEFEKNLLGGFLGPPVEYAKEVIKGSWPELEEEIKKQGDSFWAQSYASTVLKKRWPEMEPLISKSALASMLYAERVIKGRFPEGEPAIMKDVSNLESYIRFVIKGRWPEAEQKIFSHPQTTKDYLGILAENGISDPREQKVVNQEFA